jgi:hypothetical protein
MFDTYTSGASWDKSVILLPTIALSMHRRYSVIICITLNFFISIFLYFIKVTGACYALCKSHSTGRSGNRFKKIKNLLGNLYDRRLVFAFLKLCSPKHYQQDSKIDLVLFLFVIKNRSNYICRHTIAINFQKNI